MATQNKTLGIVLYAMAIGLWTYWCTRGPDGHLTAAVAGFGILGAVYWIAVYRFRPVAAVTFLWHLLIVGLAVFVALTVNPQLDEMGGLLNLLIPITVPSIVAGGLVLSQVPRKL